MKAKVSDSHGNRRKGEELSINIEKDRNSSQKIETTNISIFERKTKGEKSKNITKRHTHTQSKITEFWAGLRLAHWVKTSISDQSLACF